MPITEDINIKLFYINLNLDVVHCFNILLSFSGTVEAYAKKMREEDENAELAPVYHTMTNLLAQVR